MSVEKAIRDFIAPLLPGYQIQFGKWLDGDKLSRYAVLKPVGGASALLIRRPQFSLMLVGALNDSASLPNIEVSAIDEANSASLPSIAANAIIEAMRASNGRLVVMRAGEPVYSTTDDNRPVFEFSISTITN